MDKYDYLMLSSKKFVLQKEYQINNLSDIENVEAILEYDYSNYNNSTKRISTLTFDLENDLVKKIVNLSGNSEINIFAILISAFACTLFKYKENPDICIPVPIYKEKNNASSQVNEEIILHYSLLENMTFKEILITAKKNIISSYENQEYPIKKILEELEFETKKNYTILLESIFIYQNINNTENKDYSNKNFIVTCNKNNNFINFEIAFNEDIYDNERIRRLSKHYCLMLKNLINNMNIPIYTIDILDDYEKKQLLIDFNNTSIDYPKNISINKIFEDKVKVSPNKIAIIHNSQTITYNELNIKSNQLARLLLKIEFTKNAIIGIMTERSIDTVIGVLGILKAGYTCLTVDYSFPEDRIKYMLENSKVNVVLTQSHIKDKIYNNVNKHEEHTNADIKMINIDDNNIYQGDESNLESIIKDDLIAHIIYTSGSTGNPKGVMIKHSNIINILYNLERKYPLLEDDVFLFKSNYTFDASIPELYGWFFGNGKLALIDNEDHKDPRKIINAILNYNVTHLNFVPSMFTMFVNTLVEQNIKSLKKLKYIFAGGEVLSSDIVKKFYSFIENVQVINLYGPTETTMCVTSFPVSRDESRVKLPIGQPMDNTKIYILNNKKMLQPIGVSGEIYIGGKGVTPGYVNRENLTTERYIDNPYINGEKLYKSGDIGRWCNDGNIDYIGRVDHQIKLRGLRIELGEIENVIKDYRGISQVLVIVKDDINKGQYLCGYIVGSITVNIDDLKEYLYKKLPVYMVPNYIMQLSEFPYTHAGKIDILNLPLPNNRVNVTNEYIEPQTELEEKLSEIWKEVLGETTIGTEDNFFNLGGNSLNAISIISKILTKFNTNISIANFFELKTIKEICKYIESKESTIYSSMKPIEEQQYYVASSAQKRIYALNAIIKNNINYNMPEVLIINGNIDRGKVNKIFNQLIQRHEAFRTSFKFNDNNLVQVIKKTIDFTVDFMELEESYINKIITSFIRPFELDKAPLLRIILVKTSQLKYYLLIDMHHIISDGTSMGIIIDEFIKLYKGEELIDLSIQYKEFSHWQHEFIKSEEFNKQEKFWLDMFSNEIPVLDLPTDFPRGSSRLYEGSTLSFELDSELVFKLKRLSAQNSVTPYIFLLSTYYILLSKYSGQEDIIVAYPIVGRPLPELNDVVGMFVNTVAMRSSINYEKSFINFLDEIKNKSLQIYENQDYQLDTLVEKLNIRRDSNRNVLFDTMFSLRDTYFSEINMGDCIFNKYNFEVKQTKFDLYFNIEDYEEKIILEMTYRIDLFKKETMMMLNKHFENIIREIVDNPYIKISDIDMISKNEKQQICYDLNLTDRNYPKNSNIKNLFEKQVKSRPNAIAVEFQDEKLTYEELNCKANQLARFIVKKNIKQGSIIAIICDRSVEMIIAIMGILKAGCAYLPIDITYPNERIRFLIKDSDSKLILTNLELKDLECDFVERVNLTNNLIYANNRSNLDLNICSDDLAYVIYTSGTTGKPKGILIRNYNVLRTVINTNYLDINENDIVLQLSNYAFDASVFDIFSSLLNGAKLVMISKNVILNIDKLSEVIIEKNISIILIPTALFNLIVDLKVKCLKDIRKIYVGGERLKSQYARKVFELTGPGKLINLYGPTESTLCATYFTINSIKDCEDNIPIGKPISNTKIYICNKYNKIQPFGIVGEICISGDGIAKGYLNRKALQSSKIIPSYFNEKEILYKTGDLAKMLPDGNIVFVDRIDNQVKVRGYRIELSEIESNILKCKFVKECIVIDTDDENGHKCLSAYIVAYEDINIDKLKSSLKKTIPEYMIPSKFTILEKLPLTLNGKIDKNSLSKITNINISKAKDYNDPTDYMEKQILDIWKSILDCEKISIYDNFFECGGNSLLAVKLEVEMKKSGLRIEVEDIYINQTIKELSEYIKNLGGV